jgi:hypothetical protein
MFVTFFFEIFFSSCLRDIDVPWAPHARGCIQTTMARVIDVLKRDRTRDLTFGLGGDTSLKRREIKKEK